MRQHVERRLRVREDRQLQRGVGIVRSASPAVTDASNGSGTPSPNAGSSIIDSAAGS
jgi:hypothetical protein